MIERMLKEIKDESLRGRVLKLYKDITVEFETKPSSVRYHHKDAGGMGRHTKEVMEYALKFYDMSPEIYECTRDDVILASFIHDFDKLDRYVPNTDEWRKKKFNQDFMYNEDVIAVNQTAKVVQICAEYGILLSDLVLNGITFHHGGFCSDLSSVYPGLQSTHMKPLAILLHCADLVSSHILGKVV